MAPRKAIVPTRVPAAGHDDRRQAIADAAGALFEQHGYADTSLAMVGKSAGVAKATVYHYFASKEDLLFALHEELMSLLEERMADRRASGANSAEIVAGVIHDILDNMDKRRGHVRVFVENFELLSGENRTRSEARRDAYAAAVEEAIATSVAEGRFRPVQPRLAALALFGMVNWAYQWYRSDSERTPAELAEDLWEIYFGGVRPS